MGKRLTSAQLSSRPGYPTEWTISRWRRDNIGPPYTRINGRVFYDLGEVEAWEQSRRGGGQDKPTPKTRGRKPKARLSQAEEI